MKINRKEFLKYMDYLAVSTSNTNFVHQHLFIEKDRMLTSDGVVCTEILLDTDIQIPVSFTSVYAYVKNIKDEEITLETTSKTDKSGVVTEALQIKGKRRKSTFVSMNTGNGNYAETIMEVMEENEVNTSVYSLEKETLDDLKLLCKFTHAKSTVKLGKVLIFRKGRAFVASNVIMAKLDKINNLFNREDDIMIYLDDFKKISKNVFDKVRVSEDVLFFSKDNCTTRIPTVQMTVPDIESHLELKPTHVKMPFSHELYSSISELKSTSKKSLGMGGDVTEDASIIYVDVKSRKTVFSSEDRTGGASEVSIPCLFDGDEVYFGLRIMHIPPMKDDFEIYFCNEKGTILMKLEDKFTVVVCKISRDK